MASAAELFRTKGYAGTSTRELSALLGLQNASLYHHIESKEELLYQLCMSTLDDVTKVFDGAIADGREPLDTLHRLATGYVEEALENRDKHATMLVEIRSLSRRRLTEFVRHRDLNVAMVEKVVAAGQSAGALRGDIKAKYLTLALFNLLNWTIFWFSPDGELTSREIGELLWSLFVSGAAPRPGGHPLGAGPGRRRSGSRG
jgi:AcrR family transcriptional regulator